MLLERNVRTLIYVGEYDWICNWVGNEAFTLAMEWSGQKDFVAEELGSWSVKNKTAGKLRSTGPLTFATIKGAGHMVSTSAMHILNRCNTVKLIIDPYELDTGSLRQTRRSTGYG